MAYQKCPVCNGSGSIIDSTNISGERPCLTCNRTGIISETTGQPPKLNIEKSKSNFEKVVKNDIGS